MISKAKLDDNSALIIHDERARRVNAWKQGFNEGKMGRRE